MKRNRNELRNIAYVLGIVAIVFILIFAFVYGTSAISGRETVSNTTITSTENEISGEEKYKNGFMASQKIVAVKLLLADMKDQGKLNDKQYEKYEKIADSIIEETARDEKVSKRNVQKFNNMVENIWDEEAFSKYYQKQQLILEEGAMDKEAMATGFTWMGFRTLIPTYYYLGLIEKEIYDEYLEKEEEYYDKFLSEWDDEIVTEFFEYSKEIIRIAHSDRDIPDTVVPDTFAEGGAHTMGATAHFKLF